MARLDGSALVRLCSVQEEPGSVQWDAAAAHPAVVCRHSSRDSGLWQAEDGASRVTARPELEWRPDSGRPLAETRRLGIDIPLLRLSEQPNKRIETERGDFERYNHASCIMPWTP